jgi:hypothetical protein
MHGATPKSPRCPNCARPMQLLRRTSRFNGLPDLCSFYCCACDEWHVEEVGPIKFHGSSRRLPGDQANKGEKSGVIIGDNRCDPPLLNA